MQPDVLALKGKSGWYNQRNGGRLIAISRGVTPQLASREAWHSVRRDGEGCLIDPSELRLSKRRGYSTSSSQTAKQAVTLASLCLLAGLVLGCDTKDDGVTAPLSNRTLPPRSLYVAPNGSASGNGSITSPWDLVTALNQPRGVFPNDTIWLRGGTYRADFVSNLTGQSGKPIVLRQYPGERATIDGKFSIMGNYATYWGFEVMYSDPARITSQIGPDPTNVPRNDKAVTLIGKFNKLINLVVHDMGDGIFATSNSEGAEIYGCVVYNSGWQGGDGGYGNNLYMQNQGAQKRVLDNVLFNSFLFGIQIYGSDQASIRNFYIQGNSIFGGGEPVASTYGNARNIVEWGGGAGMHGDITYDQNSIFHRQGTDGAMQLNAAGALPGNNLTFSNNIVHGQSFFAEWQNYTVTNNLFTSGTTPLSGQDVLISLRLLSGQSPSAHTWNNNTYMAPAASTQLPFYLVSSCAPNCNGLLFSAWRSATGYDANSSYISGAPTSNMVIVRPNQYESGRGLITVWNWTGAPTVSVNVSGVLTAGQTFAIRHVYNLFGAPVASGVYNGTAISIPLTGYTPPRPIGMPNTPASTGVLFNVFLLSTT